MQYFIVIFNPKTRNPVLLTDDHGFVEVFQSAEDAAKEATEWLDSEYRNFKVYEQNDTKV